MNTKRFFRRSRAPSGPKGHRAYAIGDVHGRLDLLDKLLARIEAENSENPARRASIIMLGDLIDRGPNSAEVIERLRTYSPDGAKVHFVMGNHEEVMLRVLDGEPGMLESWLRFGGKATLRSYGIEPAPIAAMPESEATQALRAALPAEHRAFLEGFTDTISFGDYLFVHAGIRPGVSLADQTESDLRWIRDPFLDDESDHGFIVVHGHTISNEVEVTANRIGVDTGAYCTDVLTALAIEGPKRWLLQTSPEGVERVML